MPRIPLGDIEILFVVDAHVVRVLKGFYGLLHFPETTVFFVDGFGAAEVGDHFEILVEDGDESRFFPQAGIALQDGGIQVVAVYHGAAYPGAGQRNGSEEFPFHGIPLESVLLARGDDKERPSGMTVVDGDPMGVEQVLVALAASAEMPDIVAFMVVL